MVSDEKLWPGCEALTFQSQLRRETFVIDLKDSMTEAKKFQRGA